MPEKELRICENGHKYYKSSDCPVCPICANESKPDDDFLGKLVAPARRALENNGITTIEQLAQHTQKEVMSFHGMGPSTLPKLQEALKSKNLNFKD